MKVFPNFSLVQYYNVLFYLSWKKTALKESSQTMKTEINQNMFICNSKQLVNYCKAFIFLMISLYITTNTSWKLYYHCC